MSCECGNDAPSLSFPCTHGRCGWSADEVSKGTVLHLQFKSQHELCEAMMRVQEFYESPYNQIRNQYFKRETFEVLYALDHGGEFSYHADWHGFNVPGNIVRQFFETFNAEHDLTPAERKIQNIINAIDPHFYLIATYEDANDTDDDAVLHELCHAMWYLDPEYRARAFKEVSYFWHLYPKAARLLRDHLKSQGYSDSVMDDEFNAYLATTPLDWWQEHLSNILARALYRCGEPFRQLAGVKC